MVIIIDSKPLSESVMIHHQESKYSGIGSDNGLVPARWQAIVWTNDGYFTDAYMRHSASMS